MITTLFNVKLEVKSEHYAVVSRLHLPFMYVKIEKNEANDERGGDQP